MGRHAGWHRVSVLIVAACAIVMPIGGCAQDDSIPDLSKRDGTVKATMEALHVSDPEKTR